MRNRDKLYVVWYNMKCRCYKEDNPRYKRYGARGITVCDKWLNDYHNFKAWAIENGYKEGLTLDRIDNNGGYRPDNCRWVTRITQANNRSNNRIENYRGFKGSVAMLCRLFNKDYQLVNSRLQEGMSIEDAMADRLIPKRSRAIEYNGELHTIAEWTRILGFKKNTISERLRNGWNEEKALTTPVRKRGDV